MPLRDGRRLTALTTTHILRTGEVDIAYDVRGPLTTADGRAPLFLIGQPMPAKPMPASDFTALASHFPDRTVVTYDPRGLGRSIRKDGRVDQVPTVQAAERLSEPPRRLSRRRRPGVNRTERTMPRWARPGGTRSAPP